MYLDFVPLAEETATGDFDCGVPSLNDFFMKHALINQKRRLGVTVVGLERERKPPRVVGYYTVCPAQIECGSLPRKHARSLPRYPVPAIRLCRLAVDRASQGRGLGKELLVHALLKCCEQSRAGGGSVVLVDATDEKARAFYERFGFMATAREPLLLVMRVQDIERTFGGQSCE